MSSIESETDGTLKFTPGDAQWEKFRKRALSDLYWFCAHVLGYGERVPMRPHMHSAFCRFVQRKTGDPLIDNARFLKLEMPRETGKSTILTQGYVVQLLCGNPNLSIMLANEKEQTASDFLSAIKWQFESNEVLKALFPEVVPQDFNSTVWSSTRIVVNRTSSRREPSVFVTGVGGTVTGAHPDIIIVDDMISRVAAENARAGSWQIMHQVNRWCHQLDMLLNKNYERAAVYWVGTRWHHGDSYEHLEEAFGQGQQKTVINLRTKLPNGEMQIVPTYHVGELAVFRRAGIENGRPAFPEVWSMERMAASRLRDEGLFACNVMNNPSDEQTALFKTSWLRYYEWVNDTQVTYTDQVGKRAVLELDDFDKLFFVDPGGFASRQVEDRARPAVAVVGDDRKGQYLILDIYNEHDTFLACIDQICAWVTRYEPRKIIVENAGQQIAFIQLLRNTLRERGLNTPVEEIKTGGRNKEVRILGLEPYFQRGTILIGKGPNFHTFREQYTQFPRTARVDVLDVLAYLPQFMRRGTAGRAGKSQHARQQEELAAYKQRRGIA